MKKYLKAYRSYLLKAATGVPIAPFSAQLWEGIPEALANIAVTLGLLAVCLVSLVTYPISVFVWAALACERDRKNGKRSAEYLREMSRGDCIDWTE